MTVTPELVDVLEAAIESRMLDVHTSIPGVVQSYDSATQTAVIELQIRRAIEGNEDDDEEGEIFYEDLPVLLNVPVVFPRTKKFMITFPIEPEDTGDVIVSEVPIGQWRAVDGTANPDSLGRLDLSGAKFYPGLSKDADAIGDDVSAEMVVGEIGGIQVRINSSAVEVVSGGAGPAADFVALAAKVDDFISKLDAIFRTKWVPVANDGGAALKTAYATDFLTPPASTASTNLKAD
jgi:hypothetical protein